MHVQHNFLPGDILARRIPGLRMLWHFGVLVGPDAVVHLSLGGVTSCTFQEFGGGETVKHAYLKAKDRNATIERARSAVGTGVYRVLDNNCEKFAHWCATGEDNCGIQATLAKLVISYVTPNAYNALYTSAEHQHAEQAARAEAADVLAEVHRDLEAMEQANAEFFAAKMAEIEEDRRKSAEFRQQIRLRQVEREAELQAELKRLSSGVEKGDDS